MSLHVLQVKFAGNLLLPFAQIFLHILDGTDDSKYSHFLLIFDKVCLDGSTCCEDIHVHIFFHGNELPVVKKGLN